MLHLLSLRAFFIFCILETFLLGLLKMVGEVPAWAWFAASGLLFCVMWALDRGWVRRVEPFHLIAVGVVVALFGVVWQGWRSYASPSPPVLSIAATAPPGSATGPEKRRYTRVALEGRQAALSALSAQVDKIADDFVAMRSPIFENWPAELPKMGIKGYAKRVADLRDRMDRAGPEIEAVLSRYGYEDLRTMANWKVAPRLLLDLDVWRETVEGIPEESKDQRPFPNKVAWHMYVHAVETLKVWIVEMRGEIVKKRAEYETAEVYQ